MSELVFLKLGGSLITDKTRPYTARLDILPDLAEQIARAQASLPGLRLVLGHGSGSFGHTAAKEFGTREGLRDWPPPLHPSPVPVGTEAAAYWSGFAEVWKQAAALNRIVLEALAAAGLPVMAFPPSAMVTARDGQVAAWDTAPLRAALAAGLLPVIFGDVVFDQVRGGTILSTEDLFAHLARELRPARILIAGMEQGVWKDFPARGTLVARITPAAFSTLDGLGEAQAVDVTGGMAEKVRLMLDLCTRIPGLQARIFSGEPAGAVAAALRGEPVGTLIEND